MKEIKRMNEESNREIKKTLSKSEKGFSLLEILIALALLAGAGTFVAGKMFESMHKGRVSTAKTQMGNIANMLRSYKADCNVYPTTEQGLLALEEKPTTGRECTNYNTGGYVGEDAEIPLDPWEGEYQYTSNGKKFSLLSFGADKQEGGEDQDADIPFRKKRRRRGK